MSKISPCLWFNRQAEEAARFYVSLLPGSRVTHVQKSSMDWPAGKAGDVILVEFELAGQSFQALNGGPHATFNMAISMSVDCADQAEVDRLWEALTADGGEPVQCGWLKDRYGMSWQIVPRRLVELMNDPAPARAQRAMQAMMGMVKIDVAALEEAVAG